MTGEHSAFQANFSNPSETTLLQLLRAYQGRVHRLCYQVLHNSHDAEDAAQEALIKIPGEIRRFTDPDSFRRWLNRVSLNAALEVARKAARRRAHEARAAMQKPAPEPLDPATRLALFEGIAALDEDPRNLLLDHYFEGESMESIGSRKGCSAPAVFKRLERARESLRRRLGGAGAMAVLPDLEALFPDTPPPPDLVSGPVLAKVAATLAAGGIAVTSKNTILLAVVITAFICLAAGTGLGVALNSRTARAWHRKVEDLERKLADADRPRAVAKPVGAGSLPVSPAVEPPASPKVSPLTARLNRYKEFKDAWKRESEELKAKFAADFDSRNSYVLRKYREQTQELEGLWKLAFAEPEVFMDFIRDPGNEPYLQGFPINALGFAHLQPEGYSMVRPQKFEAFPAPITDGMIDLVKNGTTAQRAMAMDFFARVTGTPSDLLDTFRALLQDPEPSVQASAIGVLTGSGGTAPEDLKTLIRLGESSTDATVRDRIVNALRYADTPEAAAYLMDRLEAPRDDQEFLSTAVAAGYKIMMATRISSAPSEERYLAAVSAGWGRVRDDGSYRAIISTLLGIPGDKIKPVLTQGLAFAPSPKSKELLAAILKRMEEGETNRQTLMSAVFGK